MLIVVQMKIVEIDNRDVSMMAKVTVCCTTILAYCQRDAVISDDLFGSPEGVLRWTITTGRFELVLVFDLSLSRLGS